MPTRQFCDLCDTRITDIDEYTIIEIQTASSYAQLELDIKTPNRSSLRINADCSYSMICKVCIKTIIETIESLKKIDAI